MSQILFYFILISLSLLLGCQESSNSKSNSTSKPPPSDHDTVLDEDHKAVIEKRKQQADLVVEEISRYLDETDCASGNEHADCEEITVKFSDGRFDEKKGSEDEVVLIIDNQFGHYPVSRYRSRIIDHFQFNSASKIELHDAEVEMPIYLKNILQRMDGLSLSGDVEQAEPFVPAMWFSNLSERLRGLPHQDTRNLLEGHGAHSLTTIMEYNPNARVILFEGASFDDLIEEELCLHDKVGFDSKVQASAKALKELIEFHKVKFINASFGSTMTTLKQTWNDNCKKPGYPNSYDESVLRENLVSIGRYYDAIFNTEGVVGIQASGINIHPNDNLLDIDTRYTNRIRSAYFNEIDSELDKFGRPINGKYPKLDPNLSNSVEHIDIFINFGYIEFERIDPYNNSPFLNVDPFASTMFPMNHVATSWSAPMVVSRVIHLMNTEFDGQNLTNSLIQDLKQSLTPPYCSDWALNGEAGQHCKMQDPLIHLQTEAHRLGFMTRIEPYQAD